MFICYVIHIFICLIGKDGSNFQSFIFWKFIVVFLKFIVIFSQCLNGIYRKQSSINILSLWMNMLLMMLHDMLYNIMNPFIIVIQFSHINIMPLAVFRVIYLLWIDTILHDLTCKNSPLVLYRKPQYVSICNGIFNHIAVQTSIQLISGIENISRSTSVSTLIFFKNRSTSKADIICILEMLLNLSMHLSKLAPVALINDKHYFLITVCIHDRSIFFIFYRICHLLNGCHNQLFIGFL